MVVGRYPANEGSAGPGLTIKPIPTLALPLKGRERFLGGHPLRGEGTFLGGLSLRGRERSLLASPVEGEEAY